MFTFMSSKNCLSGNDKNLLRSASMTHFNVTAFRKITVGDLKIKFRLFKIIFSTSDYIDEISYY